MEFLTQWHGGRIALERAAAVLDKHKLIVPWQFNVKFDDKERTVGGLHSIDEKALMALPGDALKELVDAGALPVAYAQMISMQHLGKLAEWANQHGQFAKGKVQPAVPFQVPAELATAGGDLNLEFLNRK